jgi:gluconate 2-dehydrogenase subunit 3-like protein
VDLSAVRHILRTFAAAIVPETSALNEHVWLEVEAVMSRALLARPFRTQRQLVVFLRLLQALPIARHGRPFTQLPTHQRDAFLESIEHSRLQLVRRGFQAVRSLVFMGYYTRADVIESIGYRGAASGWEARGGAIATVPLSPTLWVEP